MDKLYNYIKSALRVSHYFHALAIFKLLLLTADIYANQSRVANSNYSKAILEFISKH
jgi:hypothetical protein